MLKLPKVISRRRKVLGRGIGSGKGGHTAGRGQKGQKSRGGVDILFEGMKTKKSLIKRLPLQRGKGKFKASKKPVIVNLGSLNKLASGSKVTVELLIKENIVPDTAKELGVKILGGGELTKKMTIEVPMSKSVAQKLSK